MLTQAFLKTILWYDPQTGTFIWVKHHFSNLVGKRAGRLNQAGYRQISIDDKLYYEHQLAFLYMTGRFALNIDHKNRIRNANEWENLREATDAQNNVNIKVRKNNKLGVKGVCSFKGKFRAYIKINKQSRYIGVYDTIEEASNAHNKKAKELHGEFYNEGD